MTTPAKKGLLGGLFFTVLVAALALTDSAASGLRTAVVALLAVLVAVGLLELAGRRAERS